jgi:hypothetical protein
MDARKVLKAECRVEDRRLQLSRGWDDLVAVVLAEAAGGSDRRLGPGDNSAVRMDRGTFAHVG